MGDERDERDEWMDVIHENDQYIKEKEDDN